LGFSLDLASTELTRPRRWHLHRLGCRELKGTEGISHALTQSLVETSTTSPPPLPSSDPFVPHTPDRSLLSLHELGNPSSRGARTDDRRGSCRVHRTNVHTPRPHAQGRHAQVAVHATHLSITYRLDVARRLAAMAIPVCLCFGGSVHAVHTVHTVTPFRMWSWTAGYLCSAPKVVSNTRSSGSMPFRHLTPTVYDYVLSHRVVIATRTR
jgi:hypothetical protein